MNFERSYNNENSNSNLVTLFYSNDESFPISLSGKCLNSLNYLNQVNFISEYISLRFDFIYPFIQELLYLGFNSIYLNDEELNFNSESLNSSTSTPTIDFNSLIVTITESIKRYRTQLPMLDKLQEK